MVVTERRKEEKGERKKAKTTKRKTEGKCVKKKKTAITKQSGESLYVLKRLLRTEPVSLKEILCPSEQSSCLLDEHT